MPGLQPDFSDNQGNCEASKAPVAVHVVFKFHNQESRSPGNAIFRRYQKKMCVYLFLLACTYLLAIILDNLLQEHEINSRFLLLKAIALVHPVLLVTALHV